MDEPQYDQPPAGTGTHGAPTRGGGESWSDWDAVPEVGPDTVADPYWEQVRGGSSLPLVYMPPSMPGHRPGWVRVSVWVLVVVFLTATFLGVCLTYGPGQ